MAVPGIAFSYETVRRWTVKFGQQYANELHRLKGCQYVPRVIITGYSRVGEAGELRSGQARDIAWRRTSAAQTPQ